MFEVLKCLNFRERSVGTSDNEIRTFCFFTSNVLKFEVMIFGDFQMHRALTSAM